MVSQTQLRSRGIIEALKGKVELGRQKREEKEYQTQQEEQKKFEEQQKLSEEQKSRLQKEITALQSEYEYYESLPISQRKPSYKGDIAEAKTKLDSYKEILSNISGGGYYEDFESVVKNVNEYANYVGKSQYQSYGVSKKQSSTKSTSITIGASNTYDVDTGTYTDKAGNKFSMIKAPEGARVVSSKFIEAVKKTSVEPTISRVPVSSDVRIGKKVIGKDTYDVYQAKTGEKFLGGYNKQKRFEKVRENIRKLSTPIILTYANIGERVVRTIGSTKTFQAARKSLESEKTITKLNKLSEELLGLEKGNVEGEYWTGSDEGYKEYDRKREELERVKNEFISMGGNIDEQGNIVYPTIQEGFFGLTKEKSIEGYGGLLNKWTVVPRGIDILGKNIFATTGELVEKTGISQPERNITYEYTALAPYSSGTAQYNPLTGEQIVFKTYKGSYIRPAITPEQFGETVYKVGSKAVGFGKYAIPYGGQVLFFSETIGRVSEEGGIKSYIRNKPTEALLTGAVIVSGGLFAGGRYLTKVRPTEIIVGGERGLKYSSRMQDWFGKRVSVSKEGWEILPSKKYEYQKYKKSLIPSEERELISKVMKPKLQEEIAGKTITYFDELTGTARQIKIGSKTIVETPKGILYGGNPYGKLGKLEREKVKDFLRDKGYTDKQIKDMLRLRQPQALESSYLGKGEIIEDIETGKMVFKLKGKVESKPIQIETEGIKTRMGEGRIKFVDIVGKPIEGGKGEVQLFKSLEEVKSAYLTRKGYPYSKVKQAGKTKELFEVTSGTKEIELKELPRSKMELVKNKEGLYTLELSGAKLEYLSGKEFIPYRDISIIKRISPSTRKLETAKSIVLVEKGEPELKVSYGDETFNRVFDIPKVEAPQIQKQVSKLLSTEEKKEVISAGMSNIKKYLPEVKQPRIKSTPILETKEITNFPLIVGGTGGVSSLYAGTGQYEVQEFGATKLINLPMDKTFVEKQIEVNLPKVRIIDILKGIEIEKTIQKPILDLGFKEVTKPKEELKVQERLKLNQLLKIAQQLKQEQRLKLGQALKLKQGQKFKSPQLKIPKIKIPFELKKPKTKVGGEEDLFGGFKVFVKKKGQEEILEDTFGTLGEAKLGLKKQLISTLRASGGIYKGKEKLSFEDIGIGDMEFRPSRKNKFLVVEKKEKRLRKKTTGKQIQVFR